MAGIYAEYDPESKDGERISRIEIGSTDDPKTGSGTVTLAVLSVCAAMLVISRKRS